MADTDSPSARVRASVRLSRNERNARVRFMANYEDIAGIGEGALADSHREVARVWGFAARAWKHTAERLAGSLLPGPDGRIDFEQDRCFFSAGAYGVLVLPGHRYQGEPGEWEQDDDYEGKHFLTEEDPFWVLELVAATSEATDCGDETVLGRPAGIIRGSPISIRRDPTRAGSSCLPIGETLIYRVFRLMSGSTRSVYSDEQPWISA